MAWMAPSHYEHANERRDCSFSRFARCLRLQLLSSQACNAKRQALDALDDVRRGGDGANGDGKPANDAEIETVVDVPRRPHVTVTLQFAFAGLAAIR